MIEDSVPAEAVPLEAAPPTSFDWDGETWTVSKEGGSRSGTGSDIGASLLLIRFSPGSGDHPPREVIVAATSLEELGEDGLRDVFRRAKARQPPPERPAVSEPLTDEAPVSE